MGGGAGRTVMGVESPRGSCCHRNLLERLRAACPATVDVQVGGGRAPAPRGDLYTWPEYETQPFLEQLMRVESETHGITAPKGRTQDVTSVTASVRKTESTQGPGLCGTLPPFPVIRCSGQSVYYFNTQPVACSVSNSGRSLPLVPPPALTGLSAF